MHHTSHSGSILVVSANMHNHQGSEMVKAGLGHTPRWVHFVSFRVANHPRPVLHRLDVLGKPPDGAGCNRIAGQVVHHLGSMALHSPTNSRHMCTRPEIPTTNQTFSSRTRNFGSSSSTSILAPENSHFRSGPEISGLAQLASLCYLKTAISAMDPKFRVYLSYPQCNIAM